MKQDVNEAVWSGKNIYKAFLESNDLLPVVDHLTKLCIVLKVVGTNEVDLLLVEQV